MVACSSSQGLSTNYNYSFIDAGTASGILGAGGKNTGGWQLTTSAADGRSSIDKTDYFNLLSWRQDQGARTYTYSHEA